MRTKVLLSLAAFAVSAFAAYAQSNVYSVNIVGYVNQVLPFNANVAAANPLDNGTNDLQSVYGTLAGGSQAQFWDGVSTFTPANKVGTTWTPNTPIPPGVGFFIKAASKTAGSMTNTYVGEVVVGPGESVTNTIPLTKVMVGSPIPYAGDPGNPSLGLTAMPGGSQIQLYNPTTLSYEPINKSATSWSGLGRTNINVAEGFFIQSSKSAYQWVQSLPANP
jgi:hypothetical protein